jgi:hypothetical protein
MRQFGHQLFVHLVRKVLAAGQRTQGSLATHSPSHSCHGESASVEKRELFRCHLALDKWVPQQHRAHAIDATSHQRIPTAVVEHILLLGRWHVPLSAKCDGRRHAFCCSPPTLPILECLQALAISAPSDYRPTTTKLQNKKQFSCVFCKSMLKFPGRLVSSSCSKKNKRPRSPCELSCRVTLLASI